MRKIWLVVGAGAAIAVAVATWRLWPRDDGWPPHDGRLRQTMWVGVDGLRRGMPGPVTLRATAHYTRGDVDDVQRVDIPAVSGIELALVDAAGKATPVAFAKAKRADGAVRGEATLPDVPDGDYKLHVRYRTRLGPGEVDVPLGLYAPARAHVITDRPLYEPGNVVRFRAVVLRAADLAPLDGRPGTWTVTDPQGDVLLEERAPAGPWGVVAGSFPLDGGAEAGDWKVSYRSGATTETRTFTVKEFTLPRFRVDASAERPVYHRLERPVVRGAVLYSSGAPVAGAELTLEWQASGDWPPPTDWLKEALPQRAVTGAGGRFELPLPEIPADLEGTTTLTARISAVDPAGDRVEGRASVLLASDRIAVSAVTELGDGLVGGTNNRVYLRVTTADGRVLRDTKILVRRAWQADDPGVEATTDADGVASLQLDPGPPVNVVIPPKPYRPPPPAPAVTRGDVEELIGGEGASLADQVELDRWLVALTPCARWYQGDDGDEVNVDVGVRVAASGALSLVATAGSSPLSSCVVQTLRARRLPPGGERLYAMQFTFTDPPLPYLATTVEAAIDPSDSSALQGQLEQLALRARDCLPAGAEGSLSRMLQWRLARGSKAVVLGPWIADPDADVTSAPLARALDCATQRFAGARLALPYEADHDAFGVVRFEVEVPEIEGAERPQATTMLGYELEVIAEVADEQVPRPATRLRLSPGSVPPLRLRVAPVLAAAGETVTAELLRGPDFTSSGQKLPDELVVSHRKGTLKLKLDDQRKATLTVPADAEGWLELTGGGARGLVYVRPKGDLVVTVTPSRATYGPGQQADLILKTLIGGQGAAAAVGLFGVDDSLAQLATLPDGDDLGSLRPKVTTSSPAFGTLDAQALTLGRIQGANAAAATVLRVTGLPTVEELDAVVTATGQSHFDPVEELTDRFYDVLAELHAQVRAWESAAPAGELMRPATMAKLWKQALAACAKRGQAVTDAFGRRLRLSRLPADLLALTDPRAVVIVGTRLPEDVEDWAAWVAKEKP